MSVLDIRQWLKWLVLILGAASTTVAFLSASEGHFDKATFFLLSAFCFAALYWRYYEDD